MAYFNQCLPKVVNIRDGSGCSITRATLDAMTPDQFAALGDQEDLQRVYATATEAKMRGVHQRYIDQLLMGRLKYYGDRVNKTNIGGSQSIIQPFITQRQKTVARRPRRRKGESDEKPIAAKPQDRAPQPPAVARGA